MKIKKTFPLFLAIFFLCGCSRGGSIYANYREISQLQIIQTIGLDSGGGVVVTAWSTAGPGGTSPMLISRSGPSVPHTMDYLQDFAARENLFYSHINKVIFGEEAAREGVAEFLDCMERAPALRLDTRLFIVCGGDAKSLMTGSSAESGAYNVTELLNSLVRDIESRGEGRVFDTSEVAQALATGGSALVCAIKAAPTEGVIFSEHPEITIVPAGYAILKEERLAGFLSGEAAYGVNLLQERAYHIIMEAEAPGGAVASIEIASDGLKFLPAWAGDGALERLDVEISLHAGILDVSDEIDLNSPETIDALNAQISARAEQWVSEVLNTSRELGADFLGLGAMLRRREPVRFAQMPVSWPETLPALETGVRVEASVERSFDLENPVNIRGGGKTNVTGQ